ncbi:hypothetical protein BD289DRAFT_121016 [Coniella lustricola]|uniref:Uncharacterized protein n=1 Tax=Coniella lustricola TaxID=2025994 RepID=A0A2T2ZWS5_9PEZI|nr:hypothetical protein BD289DRAFT_121016 [Coniella lustricola]
MSCPHTATLVLPRFVSRPCERSLAGCWPYLSCAVRIQQQANRRNAPRICRHALKKKPKKTVPAKGRDIRAAPPSSIPSSAPSAPKYFITAPTRTPTCCDSRCHSPRRLSSTYTIADVVATICANLKSLCLLFALTLHPRHSVFLLPDQQVSSLSRSTQLTRPRDNDPDSSSTRSHRHSPH